MSEKLDKNTIGAFADGELDVQQNLQVMSEMAQNPDTAKQVLHQQQLRETVKRNMAEQAPALPDTLRSQIEAMMVEQPVEQALVTSNKGTNYDGPRVIGRVGNWVPAAVAAVLLIAALPGYFAMTNQGSRPAGSGSVVRAGYSDLIPFSQTQRFARRHVSCSRLVDKMLHADKFPQDLHKVPKAVTDFIGTDPVPNLDLSAMGYEFSQMGECIIPGDQSVHLIYRATESSGKADSISLWMRRYDGKPAIDAEQLYVLADETTPHPVIMWRQEGMIYYVAGDGLGPALGARETLLASR